MTEQKLIENGDAIRAVCSTIVARAVALNLKGKKRDEMALNYFIGAIRMAEVLGNTDLQEHMTRIACFILAIRSPYDEAVRLSQPKASETDSAVTKNTPRGASE